jgi:hypothetical protein
MMVRHLMSQLDCILKIAKGIYILRFRVGRAC